MKKRTKPTSGGSAAPTREPIGGMLFRQLTESPEFSEFALILKRLTGLAMAMNTPDVSSTRMGVPKDSGNPFCSIIRGSSEGLRRCGACDRKHHASAAADGKAKLYTCHAGFLDMAIPIIVQGSHVATISSGQVLPERPSDAGFKRMRRRLRWLDIPEGRLRRAYDKAPWMPRDRLEHVMRLLEIFARQLCDSAWRLRELEARHGRDDIWRVKELIEERFRDPGLRLADAASCAGLSVAHFSHLFHKETGLTFTKHVQSRRVHEAKRLLAESDKSVTEICYECGFNSLTHFNRVFRSGELRSPRQYRERQRDGTRKAKASAPRAARGT